MSIRSPIVAAAFVVTAFAGPIHAQETPSADELIAAHVEAIGGADLYIGETSMTTGSVSMPALGIGGSFQMVQIYPGTMRMSLSIEGLGDFQTGFLADVGWSLDPILGARLMEGAELDQTREQASVLGALRDPSVVPERETVGLVEMGDDQCWRVRLTWTSGRESFDCYSVETGLLIGSESRQASPMGEVLTISRFEDYQDFDGRLVATRVVQRAEGIEQILSISGIVWGEVDATLFEPPAPIRTLMGG